MAPVYAKVFHANIRTQSAFV